MHEFMDQNLEFFSFIKLVVAFMNNFDDIGHGQSSYLVKDLAKAPNPRDCPGFGIKTPDTKYPIRDHMSELDLWDQKINTCFDIGGGGVLHAW